MAWRRQEERQKKLDFEIAERHRAELSEQEVLREANRRKDEFLATLAHELRNPLAPIASAVQMLKMKGSLDRDLNWSRDVIERQVAQMARLLDDLFDLARINRNKLDIKKQRVQLAAKVASAGQRPISVKFK